MCFNITPLYGIVTKFCTCKDSTTVMPLAKFFSNHFIATWLGAKLNFIWIWIVMEKSFVKWAIGLGPIEYIPRIMHTVYIFVEVCHSSDVIMSMMASQIISVSIFGSAICSGRSKKTSKLHITGLCEENPPVTGGFHSQRDSNAENVLIDNIIMSTNDFIHILQGHLYWHRGSHTTIPDLVKQSWTIWVKTNMKSPRTDLTTTKQSKTKHDDDMVWKHYPHYLPSADSSYKGPVMGSFDVFFVISLDKMSNSQVVDYRNHSVHALSQWEMALHCNAISHWLGAYTEWSLA